MIYILTSYLLMVIVFLAGYVVTRLVLVLREIYANRKAISDSIARRKSQVKTLIIVGSGGHTTEMLRLVEPLASQYQPLCYVIAHTDHMSEEKVMAFEKSRCNVGRKVKFNIEKIYRSREVGQSWLTSILSTLYASFGAVPLVWRFNPDLILCNGPGTCIPICIIAFIFRVLMLRRSVIIYTESVCRVTSLSLSGHLLRPFADHILVQWPELHRKYPQTEYIGRLV